jgi:hypothetical protein
MLNSPTLVWRIAACGTVYRARACCVLTTSRPISLAAASVLPMPKKFTWSHPLLLRVPPSQKVTEASYPIAIAVIRSVPLASAYSPADSAAAIKSLG